MPNDEDPKTFLKEWVQLQRISDMPVIDAPLPRHVFVLLFHDRSCYVGYSDNIRTRIKTVRRFWPNDPDPKALVLVDAGIYIATARRKLHDWRQAARNAGHAIRVVPFNGMTHPTEAVHGYEAGPANARTARSAETWPSFDMAPSVPLDAPHGEPGFVYPTGDLTSDPATSSIVALTAATLPAEPPRRRQVMRSNEAPSIDAGQQTHYLRGHLIYALVALPTFRSRQSEAIICSTTRSFPPVVDCIRDSLQREAVTDIERFARQTVDEEASLIAIELEYHRNRNNTLGRRVHAWKQAAAFADFLLPYQPTSGLRVPKDALWPTKEWILLHGIRIVTY